jgi:hypothetical protein
MLLPDRPTAVKCPASVQMASPIAPISRATPPLDTRPVAVCIAVTETHKGPSEITLTGSNRLDRNMI